ncbi:UNVERIFIED_CONTAM: Alpha-L-arabinofuranosidase 1 [Sesamum radiatum]|uniref:non-reducing end alpha-L-arabinofuranosidase n=1 Tax=Sesamum radiatum TaxID=300843 RepID=A0AAW2TJ37_SESRA
MDPATIDVLRLFKILQEINHAGAGGLWAELVSNRGFEAGGPNTPSNIEPWSVIGDESSLLYQQTGHHASIGIKLHCEWRCFAAMKAPCVQPVELVYTTLASGEWASDVSNWTKLEAVLQAKGTDANSRLQLTTTRKGVIWFDQVSLMPTDTYKGHGFRNDLFEMVKNMKPAFIRFPGGSLDLPFVSQIQTVPIAQRDNIFHIMLPQRRFNMLASMLSGGCFVEGEWLRNAFRWKETIGPWEERPGHFGDVWHYWTDDGLGHFEFLQLAEDLGALPIWVFNNGVSHNDEVDTSSISPFLQEILDGIEFARGDPDSKWGSVRAAMGHPEPFDLRYVAVGNEDCGKKNYLGFDFSPTMIKLVYVIRDLYGNYLKFYSAIKNAYPDIKIISNCDGSSRPLDHPADLYDYHIYSSANNVFASATKFDKASRNGPKAFVSEYAVTGNDAGKGSLLAALAEAGFLIGLEKNCDAVEMASYAPLFVNTHDRTWNPDAIVFDSSQAYGTPSYWMQHFFRESNGATLLSSTLQTNPSSSLIASAITWKDTEDKKHLRIKVVNFGSNPVLLQISIVGLEVNSLQSFGSTKTELTSSNVMDENSFQVPSKVVPVKTQLDDVGEEMDTLLSPHSVTSLDFVINSDNIRIFGSDAVDKSPY